MGNPSFTGFVAKGSFGGRWATAQMGGGTPLNNDVTRTYAYPEVLPVELPPATVTTPQPFTIEYDDANGVTWRLVKNSTNWTIMEKGQ
jgi:hypothetical protein